MRYLNLCFMLYVNKIQYHVNLCTLLHMLHVDIHNFLRCSLFPWLLEGSAHEKNRTMTMDHIGSPWRGQPPNYPALVMFSPYFSWDGLPRSSKIPNGELKNSPRPPSWPPERSLAGLEANWMTLWRTFPHPAMILPSWSGFNSCHMFLKTSSTVFV